MPRVYVPNYHAALQRVRNRVNPGDPPSDLYREVAAEARGIPVGEVTPAMRQEVKDVLFFEMYSTSFTVADYMKRRKEGLDK